MSPTAGDDEVDTTSFSGCGGMDGEEADCCFEVDISLKVCSLRFKEPREDGGESIESPALRRDGGSSIRATIRILSHLYHIQALLGR